MTDRRYYVNDQTPKWKRCRIAGARSYEYGQAAALRGEPIAVCRYTRPDRINAWRRGWRAGRAYYQYGQAAALRGEPIALCPCRRPDWANAWRTGWRAGEVLRREIEVLRAQREHQSRPRRFAEAPGQPKPVKEGA